ncbi:MAG: mechanosensitive ion channel [Propionivibrio sp.]|uniref:Small-conductance mechanosensitive channel n=1 Tax=Candidatus Propionivibrio dominans TaxID=2954373 RepID=A0A9D7I7H9_9RHOO|nr:mechanosensitive ion channel [Candidatus Propionivibrio dominans]
MTKLFTCRCFRIVQFLWLFFFSCAGVMAADAPVKEATLEFNFRPIMTFRALFAGATPEVRVERALARLNKLTPSQMEQPIEQTHFELNEMKGIGLRIGDAILFSVLAGDLDAEEKLSLEEAAQRAEVALAEALRSEAEQRQPALLIKGLVRSLIASALAFVLLWLVLRATRYMVDRLQDVIGREDASAQMSWARHGWSLVKRLAQLVMGFLWLSIAYLWLTFVLDSFPLTDPLGNKLGTFLFGLLYDLGSGLLGALPGLTTALVILFLTKAFNDAISSFFNAVKEGRAQVAGLHKETVSATHRIVSVVVWGFGIAIAYPFIPSSSSDVFRGLSVMFGFMLTLGSAGIVNQLMSGLVLVYSRALSKGDFVDLGDTVGVVSEVGVLSTKIINMRNEEVTIPNAVLVGNPIKNYSRLAGERGTLVSTKVTIGYDTPWRQVHAMLIAAAEHTPGLRNLPKPFVFQRALADFYVEYELFAHMDKPLERVAVLSALHGHIQDEFNTHGVQIMSPHFVLQPRNNVVVPAENWYATPAEPKQ